MFLESKLENFNAQQNSMQLCKIVFTISAIFSAGVLQSSVDEEPFFGLLEFPSRCKVTALASL